MSRLALGMLIVFFISFHLPSSSVTESDQNLCFGQQRGGSSDSDSNTRTHAAAWDNSRYTSTSVQTGLHAVSEKNINSKISMYSSDLLGTTDIACAITIQNTYCGPVHHFHFSGLDDLL